MDSIANLSDRKHIGTTRPYDTELLYLIHQRQCSRIHDKVYSILGLISPEIRSSIVIDYFLKYQTLFLRFAKALLKFHGPSILVLSPSFVPRQKHNKHPTWVPDLASPPLMTHTWHRNKAGVLTTNHPAQMTSRSLSYEKMTTLSLSTYLDCACPQYRTLGHFPPSTMEFMANGSHQILSN